MIAIDSYTSIRIAIKIAIFRGSELSQAFYINDDSLETPEALNEEAASDARIDDLLNPANQGAHCDYCGTWCANGEYDSDWMGTGLSVCYAGEHEAEKAESEASFWHMSPCSPRHFGSGSAASTTTTTTSVTGT